MDHEPSPDLLARATAAYRMVVADPVAAGPVVVQLVSEARDSADHRALVAALRAQAWYERSRLAHDRAAKLLDEAIRLARREDLRPQWQEALTARGAVRHELGRLVAAQRDLHQAATLTGPDGDPELDSQQAALDQNAGRLTDAATAYRRILSREDTPPQVRTKAANNLGIIEVQCGRPEDGLAWFDVAASAAREVGPAVVAIVSEGRAWATVRAGRLSEGMALFEASARLWSEAELPLGELHAEYADALVDLRLIPEATREAKRALSMLDRQGVALMAAEAQLRTAHLALLSGDPTTALTEAEAVARRLGGQLRRSWTARARLIAVDARLARGSVGPGDLATARRAAATLERAGLVAEAVDGHLSAGRVAAAVDRPQSARAAWSRAELLARKAPLLIRLKGRVAGALSATLDDRARAVVQQARAGLDDLARHRAALPSAELRALASGHGAELGGLGLAAVARSRPASDVLAWMERTRATALVSVDPPEIEGIEELLGRLRSMQGDLAVARREGAANLTDLLGTQTAIEERIRRATWRQRTSIDAPDRPRRVAEVRGALDGRVLVEYDLLDGDVIAAVLEPRRTRLVELGSLDPIRREQGDLSFALRRMAQAGRSPSSLGAARASADSAIAALAAQLIRPLRIGSAEGMVVVPVGELQRIPWTALHDAPVAVTPSASMWVRTKSRPRPAAERVTLVAGPDLPGAVVEVEAIAALYPHAEVLLPPYSDIAAVTKTLAGASIAHLACHGTVRTDNPMFSSLQVSDGSLTVHELDRRRIAPHRIVLAACESSSDAVYPGNETLGFVSTLLAAGTSGLVASSVVIPDWNVVALMTALHSSVLKGRTLAEALHDARATIDRDDPAGFVSWCAFNAFGAA